MPYLLGLRVETIPAETGYLGVDPARLAVWRARLQAWPGFRVGIAWRGNPRATNDATRSAALADFLALANVPSVRLFSLQKGTGREELARLDARATVIDLADYLDDLADTAAAVCALDLVVAVDTALVHLAGGLGCPVWTALAVGPDWRWLLEREDTPWYPSMRLFRQRRLGDWTAVFARMAAELAMRTAVA
jgi:ADP-heptose:LPS heptosyltransferase